MSEGNTVYNLLRSSDISWGNASLGTFSGTAQKIVCSHIWGDQIISSKAFARIFKPGHTYTLSYTVKIIELAPDTYRRSDRYGVRLYSPSGIHDINNMLWYHDNPSAGDTFHMSGTFTAADDFPGDVKILAYAGYSRDESNTPHIGVVEIDDLMIVEGSTPAAWAPAEGETLTADGGGGGMTEPTNLVKTQPDENATYTVKARVDGGYTDAVYGNVDIKLSANTSFHIGITIKPDKDIPPRRVWAWIRYKDDAGATNYAYAKSSRISYVIPAGVWTRLEWTVTVPAGMTLYGSCICIDGLSDEIKFQATNFAVYPLTGGRIVRARGTAAGYISKAKEATVLYTPSKSARQVRVILLDETGSSIYDIQTVAIVADAEELQGKVAAQESSIQTIQSDMTTVQSGLSGLNVRLASMQTELAGVSAGDVLYQVPYTVTDGKATFTAAVYKSGVECHTSYDPSCFTWYLKSEAGTVKIGTGYSVTVNVGDVGYGGFVVGVFETR